MLDVDPANPSCNYELQFRENSKCVLDNNGNRIKDSDGVEVVFKAPKPNEMWKYNKYIKHRQDNFKRGVFACIKQ